VPFIHAGDDLLRSKSLDRDSYNSGVPRLCEGAFTQGPMASQLHDLLRSKSLDRDSFNSGCNTLPYVL